MAAHHLLLRAWRVLLGRQTPMSSFFKSRFKFNSMFNGLSKSSAVKWSEHSEEDFPGTHIFLLSNTKLIHCFLLFFFIGHSSPKNGILCIDIPFLGSPTLLQRAATHLSGIFHGIFFHERDKYNQITPLEKNIVPEPTSRLRHGSGPTERRLMRMVEQNGGKFRRL